MDVLLQQILNGLILGSLYALVALGYTMVYGILELINFAHGEIVMLGAMVSVTVLGVLAALGVPVPLALLAALAGAVAVCVATGVLVERVAYRPLRSAPRLAPLITAIGVSIVLQNLAMIVWGRQYLSFPPVLDSEI
jgi:branched-chain amino acid transport system permease protein